VTCDFLRNIHQGIRDKGAGSRGSCWAKELGHYLNSGRRLDEGEADVVGASCEESADCRGLGVQNEEERGRILRIDQGMRKVFQHWEKCSWVRKLSFKRNSKPKNDLRKRSNRIPQNSSKHAFRRNRKNRKRTWAKGAKHAEVATELWIWHEQAARQTQWNNWQSGLGESYLGELAQWIDKTVLVVRKGLEWKNLVFEQVKGAAWEEKRWNI